ncbi:uncharacterized protein F4807DRAFT_84421 [Annulohypoxylon truncatum]|uniref:uncharacterized protein n=1 Tax=Annulohypoxylon truncatum TaxID=327061 RepID=UPI002008116F|nr:uncharacterized protein F4807DRAFT_84421 [Annulohypoxylon truncatum]KAI1209623.1 hypothetical protein F4807DRAFT_84421 [Annulohypoxylon truncatum]
MSNLTDILEGPALDPPPGEVSDFANPGGSHSLGYGIVILTGVLASLTVFIRLVTRHSLRNIQIEDAFLIIALGLFAGLEYVNYAGSISPGVKVHQWNVQFKYLERWQYLLHLASIFYGLTVMFLKLAILVDWLHIFVPLGQRNAIFWTIHTLIWCNIIYYVSGTFIEIFRCTPRQKFWDPLFEDGSCPVNIEANNFSSGILNLISNLAILAVPQWVIWNLQMTTAKRAGISFLFLIGIFAIACGVARIIYLSKVLDANDATYYLSLVGLWGLGEVAAGFMIMGIPALPRATKMIPFSESVALLLRPWTKREVSSIHERSNLPHWRRPFSRKRRGLWDITDLESRDLITMNSMNPGDSSSANNVTNEVLMVLGTDKDLVVTSPHRVPGEC